MVATRFLLDISVHSISICNGVLAIRIYMTPGVRHCIKSPTRRDVADSVTPFPA